MSFAHTQELLRVCNFRGLQIAQLWLGALTRRRIDLPPSNTFVPSVFTLFAHRRKQGESLT